jgi:hypothetical protein
MPALLKAKHEMIAQALAAGKTQREAYQAAGYSYKPANAHRLCTDPAIEARVNEIAADRYKDERRAREIAADEAGLNEAWIITRACFKGLSAHQSLDPVQPAGYALGQEIVPHAPGAIGPIAGKEAGTNLRADILIAPVALTAWPRQPGIESTSRDTERPAQPLRWPNPSVLRNKTELHVDSFAK